MRTLLYFHYVFTRQFTSEGLRFSFYYCKQLIINSKDLTNVFAALREDDTYLKKVSRKANIFNLDNYNVGVLHFWSIPVCLDCHTTRVEGIPNTLDECNGRLFSS
jgi:hypothetical protein